MKEKIKSVTLKLSQEGASYLQNGIYAKYFMDIMSNLHVSFKYDKETYEPELIYGPTAFFNLFELAARWNMFPEQVVAVVLELRENGAHPTNPFKQYLHAKIQERLTPSLK